jgi:hypothetical protein
VEKFLFYEAGITSECPLRMQFGESGIAVRNTGATASGPLLFVQVSQGQVTRCRSFRSLDAGATQLPEEEDGDPCRNPDRWLAERIREAGLYPNEGKALRRIFAESFWETDGTRFLWIVPQATLDEAVVLQVTPAPAEIRRFLLLQIEVGTVELTARIEELIERLGHDQYVVRRDADAALRKIGPLAIPSLRKRVYDDDLERAFRIRNILRHFTGEDPAGR